MDLDDTAQTTESANPEDTIKRLKKENDNPSTALSHNNLMILICYWFVWPEGLWVWVCERGGSKGSRSNSSSHLSHSKLENESQNPAGGIAIAMPIFRSPTSVKKKTMDKQIE